MQRYEYKFQNVVNCIALWAHKNVQKECVSIVWKYSETYRMHKRLALCSLQLCARFLINFVLRTRILGSFAHSGFVICTCILSGFAPSSFALSSCLLRLHLHSRLLRSLWHSRLLCSRLLHTLGLRVSHSHSQSLYSLGLCALHSFLVASLPQALCFALTFSVALLPCASCFALAFLVALLPLVFCFQKDKCFNSFAS